ncbi:MAG: GGDEF domain-containing protein [Coriobacteriia bacterium]|nr:GGDEF domain-containing protein [Coriobacteriia bacterium]
MWFSRLRKRVERALIVSWREQPSRHDIEALQANIRRVGLVIRVRWTLIGVLAIFSLLAASAYMTLMDVSELASLMAIPALSLGFVVVYNAFYAANYRRLGNIAVWNNLQLALDAVVVTVLVYFSGGVNSWFWSMYALFILEAAFILPRSRSAWLHAAFSLALLTVVEWGEFFGLWPHVAIPFANAEVHTDFVFVSVRYLWQVAVLLGTASVATQLVGEFRRELASRRSQALMDEMTGLYSRSYYLRSLASEIRRAERDGRELHVLLVDIYRFGEFNTRFGYERGDEMLVAVAGATSAALIPTGDAIATTNLVSRFGGEEFAVLYAEDERLDAAPLTADALGMGEHICETVARVLVQDVGVVVSVGVASYPLDGRTADELLDAADVALGCAAREGGNRAVAAADCVPDDSEDV